MTRHIDTCAARFLDCCSYELRADGAINFKGYDGAGLERLRRDLEVQYLVGKRIIQPEDQAKELVGGLNKAGNPLYLPDAAG